MSSKKYGNDQYWCFIEDEWSTREIAIWRGPKEHEEIVARAPNKYDAKLVVDALTQYRTTDNKNIFTKKEMAFLEFVVAHCVEPYSTMAANAILWNDWDTYNKLKSDFIQIYS